jgi:hypothetical protein
MKVVSAQRGGVLRGWLIFAFVLLIVLAVTGWFVARSDGFRNLVAERLEKELGLPVKVMDCYIGWPYELVLRGVGTADDASFRMDIREVRVGRAWRNWRVAVRDASFAFMPEITNSHTNRVSQHVVRVAQLRDAGAIDIMRATAPLPSNWELIFDDIDLYWLASDGGVDGSIRQADFMLKPVMLPDGKMYYYHLSYAGAAQNAMGSMRDLSWSWLTDGGDHYVELQRSGVAPEVQLEP